MRVFALVGLLLGSYASAASATSLIPDVPRAIEIGAFDGSLEPAVNEFVAQATSGQKEIVFRINSFGGSVFLGLDVIQLIEDVKRATGVRTTCVVDSKAMSMGLVFLESGACDTRLMTRRSLLLGHNASAEVRGTAGELHATEEFLRALSNSLAEIVCDRTFVPVAYYLARVEHADWVMGYREALHFGFVDAIVDPSEIPPVL